MLKKNKNSKLKKWIEFWCVCAIIGCISGCLLYTSAGSEFEPEKAELAAGVHVQGKIDWQHRFYNMQPHRGEHIFSGIVHSRFGFETVGFHLSCLLYTSRCV